MAFHQYQDKLDHRHYDFVTSSQIVVEWTGCKNPILKTSLDQINIVTHASRYFHHLLGRIMDLTKIKEVGVHESFRVLDSDELVTMVGELHFCSRPQNTDQAMKRHLICWSKLIQIMRFVIRCLHDFAILSDYDWYFEHHTDDLHEEGVWAIPSFALGWLTFYK